MYQNREFSSADARGIIYYFKEFLHVERYNFISFSFPQPAIHFQLNARKIPRTTDNRSRFRRCSFLALTIKTPLLPAIC